MVNTMPSRKCLSYHKGYASSVWHKNAQICQSSQVFFGNISQAAERKRGEKGEMESIRSTWRQMWVTTPPWFLFCNPVHELRHVTLKTDIKRIVQQYPSAILILEIHAKRAIKPTCEPLGHPSFLSSAMSIHYWAQDPAERCLDHVF